MMAPVVNSSSHASSNPKPANAYAEVLIAINSIGIRIGKPNTAIKVKLLFALLTIAEIIVRAEENPMEANNKLIENNFIFTTGLPRITE